MKKLSQTYLLPLILIISSMGNAQGPVLEGALFVTDPANASVKVIFSRTPGEVMTIPTADFPSNIVISPDRTLAVVAHYDTSETGNSLTLIDLENFEFARNISFRNDIRPGSLAFIPGSKILLVTNEIRNSLWIFDLETVEFIKEIPLNRQTPSMVSVHPSGHTAYVTSEESGTVTVIDMNALSVSGTVQVGMGVTGIDVSPDSNEIWVSNRSNGLITVIETNTNDVKTIFESPVSPTQFRFTSDGQHVIVLQEKTGTVSIINTVSKTREQLLAAEDFSPLLPQGFTGEMSASVLGDRLEKNKLGQLPIPVSITVSPDGEYAFIANIVRNSITVIDLRSDRKWELVTEYPLINSPGSVAYLSSEKNVTDDLIAGRFDQYWESNRPSQLFFTDLENVTDDEFLQEFEAPFLFVLENDERKEYELLPDIAVKKEYIRNFIVENDENPLYPVNYWYLEYNHRVEHARKYFSIDEPPYFDDRGKFHIMFGEPFEKFEDKGGPQRHEYLSKVIYQTDPMQSGDFISPVRSTTGNMLGTNDQSTRFEDKIRRMKLPADMYITLPNETWTYYTGNGKRFTVHFAKRDYFRELKNGLQGILETTTREDVSWYWMDLVKDRFYMSPDLNQAFNMIERWELEYVGVFDFNEIDINKQNISGFMISQINDVTAKEELRRNRAEISIDSRYETLNQIDFHLDVAQFRGRNDGTKIVMVAHTGNDEIEFGEEESETDSLLLEMTAMFRDAGLNEIKKKSSVVTFHNFEELSSLFVVSETALSPLEGDMTVQVSNKNSDEIGFRKYPVSVESFSGEDLLISDILYYTYNDSLDFEHNYRSKNINDYNVVHYPFPNIRRDIPLLCYFEVYNLPGAGTGPMYRIDAKLKKDNSGRSALRRLGGVFLGGGEEVRTISYNITEFDRDLKALIGFDVSDVGRGRYDLEITITSLNDESISAQSLKKMHIR